MICIDNNAETLSVTLVRSKIAMCATGVPGILKRKVSTCLTRT